MENYNDKENIGLQHENQQIMLSSRKNRNIIHQPRSVHIGKTVPSVLSTALGLLPWAVSKTFLLVNNLSVCKIESLKNNNLSVNYFRNSC